MPDDFRIDRRQFAGKLATASGAAAILASSSWLRADDDSNSPKAKDDAKPEAAEERPVEPPMELVLLSYLVRRYPSDHFDDDALRGIFGDLRGDIARGRALSDFPLKNSDEPAFVFKAYRKPE